ncbi:MAG: NfeD family protein [Azovibrio sp.]
MWTWLIIAGVLLVLEMSMGTFALLFAGLGALVAALLAYLFPDYLAIQISIFALATVAGVLITWKRLRKKRRNAPAAVSESEGQTVVVVEEPDAQGSLRVRYRGTEWPGRLVREGMEVKTGDVLVVVGQEGSVLVLDLQVNQA